MDVLELIKNLSNPLPSEAIQRTKGKITHKGYDTDGYGYQFVVNRLNDLCGDKWGFFWEIINTREGKYSNGNQCFDITVKTSIWILNKDSCRSCVGGHISGVYADALKGAITNSFKKTAAFWGVGCQAYEGILDDDNNPWPEFNNSGNGHNKDNGHKEQIPQSKPEIKPEISSVPAMPVTIGLESSVNPAPDKKASPSNGNKEARLRQMIMAKLEIICGKSSEHVLQQLHNIYTPVESIEYFNTLQIEPLTLIINEVNDLFKSWKEFSTRK